MCTEHMNNYTIVLQTATDDPDSLMIDHLDIREGRYKATFSFLGLANEGTLQVSWSGVTNHFDSLSDGAVIAATFGIDTLRIYSGELYVANPGERLEVTFHRQDDDSIMQGPLPTVRVNLERLV
jgi:hypothetical protein